MTLRRRTRTPALRLNRSDRVASIVLLAPAVLVLLVTTVYPIGMSLWVSFFSWNPMDPNREAAFVGFDNYTALASDTEFLSSIVRTLVYVGLSLTGEFLLGMAIALLMTVPLRAVSVLRTAVFVPLVMTPVVVGILWAQMLNSNYGVFNYFLSGVGLPEQDLLGNPGQAMFGVVLVEIWQNTPFMALLFAAGLLAIPQDIIDAARTDGAGAIRTFFAITLPLMRPTIFIALTIKIMDTFKVFDLIYMLTQGGPANATKVVSLMIYEQGLKFFELGRASAMSWVFLLLVVAITLPMVIKVTKGGER